MARPALLDVLGAAIVVALSVVTVRAQTPGPDPSTSADSGVTVVAAYEAHRDHQRYEFENPSSIDTAVLVPHRFVQNYVTNNQWFVVSARYPLAGDYMETEFALTPRRQAPGSDLDTFYNPDNDVVVSGTAGDVLIRSARLTHWSEGRVLDLPWRVGYRYRRDDAQFLPTDRVLTHSNPPSEFRDPTYGRETTTSQVHEIVIDASKPRTLSSRWSVIVGANVSPLVWARLTTILPDKYPGREIVFEAKVSGAGARMQIVRRQGAGLIVLGFHVGRTWSYSSARQFNRDVFYGSVAVGLRP